MQTSRTESRISLEVKLHKGRMSHLVKQRHNALNIEDEKRRIQRLVELGVYKRIELDIFPLRLPFAQKIGELEDQVIAAQQTGEHIVGWEDKRKALKRQMDRFKISNVAHPDMERLFKEEFEKLKAA